MSDAGRNSRDRSVTTAESRRSRSASQSQRHPDAGGAAPSAGGDQAAAAVAAAASAAPESASSDSDAASVANARRASILGPSFQKFDAEALLDAYNQATDWLDEIVDAIRSAAQDQVAALTAQHTAAASLVDQIEVWMRRCRTRNELRASAPNTGSERLQSVGSRSNNDSNDGNGGARRIPVFKPTNIGPFDPFASDMCITLWLRQFERQAYLQYGNTDPRVEDRCFAIWLYQSVAKDVSSQCEFVIDMSASGRLWVDIKAAIIDRFVTADYRLRMQKMLEALRFKGDAQARPVPVQFDNYWRLIAEVRGLESIQAARLASTTAADATLMLKFLNYQPGVTTPSLGGAALNHLINVNIFNTTKELLAMPVDGSGPDPWATVAGMFSNGLLQYSAGQIELAALTAALFGIRSAGTVDAALLLQTTLAAPSMARVATSNVLGAAAPKPQAPAASTHAPAKAAGASAPAKSAGASVGPAKVAGPANPSMSATAVTPSPATAAAAAVGCYICKSMDHKQKVCPQRTCGKCAKLGHSKHECPDVPQADKDRMNAAYEKRQQKYHAAAAAPTQYVGVLPPQRNHFPSWFGELADPGRRSRAERNFARSSLLLHPTAVQSITDVKQDLELLDDPEFASRFQDFVKPAVPASIPAPAPHSH